MERLKEKIEALRQQGNIPALGAAILNSQKVMAIAVAGNRRADCDTPAATDDLFHIGSCTKAMTATLMARLVDAGKLRWNQTIGETFSDLRTTMHEAYYSVTLEQLLYHRGGLPEDREPDMGLQARLWALKGDRRVARRRAIALVLERPPATPPGSKMLYSNFGYMVAGAMAEQATGKSWEELMRLWLFEPLRMQRVGFGAPGSTGERPDQPRGHLGSSCTPVEPGTLFADNPPVLGPAGTVHCSLRDWARFVRLHLQLARGKASVFLKAETAAKLHADPYKQGYAMGWGVAQPEWAKGTLLIHAGSNSMWYAIAAVAPGLDRAWLIVANCGSEQARNACEQLLRRLTR